MSGKGNKGGNKGNKGGNKEEGNKQDFKFDFSQQPSSGKKEGNAPVFDFSGKDAPMLAALQNQLGSLVGQSSGYLETLPKAVQERIKALKFLHSQRTDLEKKFEEELRQLEKKYEVQYKPLIDRRFEIISGASEPKPEELVEEKKEEPAKTEEAPKEEGKKEEEVTKVEENVKGVPEFWLQALKHHEDFGQMITEADEKALKHLTDIRITDAPEHSVHSFTIEFYFEDNEFFEDKVLKKTYILNEDPSGEVMYDHVDSTEIKWKAGKNLTVKKVTKTQKKKGGRGRGKNQGGAQTITVEEPTESFFHFFNPEAAYSMYNGGDEFGGQDEEEDEEYGLQDFLEADYELGLEVKEKLVPHAVIYFTGEELSADMFGDEESGEEEGGNDEEYNSAEDEDFEPPKEGAPAQNPQECKQQ